MADRKLELGEILEVTSKSLVWVVTILNVHFETQKAIRRMGTKFAHISPQTPTTWLN